MRQIKENYLDGNGINWIIEELDSGRPAGFIGFYRGFEHQQGEIGFILKAEFQGKGLMFAAIKLVTAFGLETIKLESIKAFTREDNQEAIAVLLRTGFSRKEEKHQGYVVFRFNK